MRGNDVIQNDLTISKFLTKNRNAYQVACVVCQNIQAHPNSGEYESEQPVFLVKPVDVSMMYVTLDDRPGAEAALPIPVNGVSTKTTLEEKYPLSLSCL